MRVAVILLALLAAACGKATEAPPSAAPTSATSSAVASLAGEWRVAGIDGQPLDEAYGIALSGSATELWWDPRCAGMARSYRIRNGAIAFGPVPINGKPPAPGSPPPPVCTVPLPPRLGEVFAALDAARTVERTPANGVLIAGGGRSVLLFSQ